jgi:tetratricopeptide (TPR) repeat protein
MSAKKNVFRSKAIICIILGLGIFLTCRDTWAADKDAVKLLNLNIENGTLRGENKKLKEDLQALKTKLERERNLNSQLELKSKELYLQAQGIAELNRDKKSLEAAFKNADMERLALKRENNELSDEIFKIVKDSRDAQARVYDKLGAVYTRFKLYDLSLESYKKSLELNPDNARVYYNLGLLYREVYHDKKTAVTYLKKYLALSPEAKDKQEVQYLVDMLSQDLY